MAVAKVKTKAKVDSEALHISHFNNVVNRAGQRERVTSWGCPENLDSEVPKNTPTSLLNGSYVVLLLLHLKQE